ncbi:peptidoglycan D,D-transpeptidase FtsI family protein [Bacillus pakistanensis]|nr:penicillin-binding protein 2 [Bacillus pakistanensis]
MNLLFFAVFILFSLLVIRLGVVQIVKGSEYKKEVERTEDIMVRNGTPRGKIYDRYGNVMVDNVPLNAITYTRAQSTQPDEMLDVAEKLAPLIKMDTEKITTRDRKDFWLLTHSEKAKKLVTKEELQKLEANEELTKDDVNKEVYQRQLERITEKDIKSFDNNELEVLAIFREFNTGYALTPQIIKNKGVTPEEMARVSEHLDQLPGVNVTTDWERTYVYDDTLRTILGNVSSSREGLPSELVNYYTAQGYSLNDRVGTSYVEAQYEDVLQGQKEKIKNITKDGSVLDTQLISEGYRGKDVVLTIDMRLQKEIEKIVEEELYGQIQKGWQSPYLDRAFVVMMDPHTGELLAMVGKKYGKNSETGKYEMQDYALGTFTSSYEAGSAVKGATVLTGYMTGNLYPGETLVDEPILIQGSKPKTSWFNKSGRKLMSDLFALEKSSNSYMWKIAFRIGGDTYIPNAPVDFNSNSFKIVRNHFSQFGLGIPTGIDLPGEMSGYQGSSRKPGFLLDLVIGQYDTYTPMQLVQYASTIANGGSRVEPHIMKQVREPDNDKGSLGPIIYENEPKVLNRINATPDEINQVQRGFYRVAHGSDGTANNFANAPYDAAAKSGTAEAFYKGPNMEKAVETYNTTLIGYAPYDSPEIAFSVFVPWSHQDKDPYVNKVIAKRVMDKYFELKKQSEKEGLFDAAVESEVRNADEAEELQEQERQENIE